MPDHYKKPKPRPKANTTKPKPRPEKSLAPKTSPRPKAPSVDGQILRDIIGDIQKREKKERERRQKNTPRLQPKSGKYWT